MNSYSNDIGRMKISGNREDSLKFKVPSLRNVALTYPYMHDGRFFSLAQVIDHYISGIQLDQPNLDSLLKNRLPMSIRDKNNLVYFLFTLTDTTLVRDRRYSQP